MGRSNTIACLLALVSSALASPVQKVVYGEDDRLDEYQVSDSKLKATGDATVALLYRDSLYTKSDEVGTTSTYTLQQLLAANDMTPCSTEPFISQPASAFCSGTLIAPNLIYTAGHCFMEVFNSCNQEAFAFNYKVSSSGESVSDVTSFDPNDLYVCKNAYVQYNPVNSYDTYYDWAIVEVDRLVPSQFHTPVTMADSDPSEGSFLRVIGHPSGIPRKYAGGATVAYAGGKSVIVADTDTYQGNSGSGVFNDNNEYVGILVSGATDFVKKGSCYISNVCDQGEWGESVCTGEQITRASLPNELLDDIQSGAERVCSGTHLRNSFFGSGSFSDGSGSSQYQANQDCMFILSTDSGQTTTLTFPEFDIASSSSCSDDYVYVLAATGVSNGVPTGSQGYGPYCGSNPPPSTLTIKTQWVAIQFKSDSSQHAGGFTINYSFSESSPSFSDNCGCSSSYSCVPLSGGEHVCGLKGVTTAIIAVTMKVDDTASGFTESEQNAFLEGLASIFSVDVSAISITSLVDVTSTVNGTDTTTLQIKTEAYVPKDDADSLAAQFQAYSTAELSSFLGTTVLEVSSVEVVEVTYPDDDDDSSALSLTAMPLEHVLFTLAVAVLCAVTHMIAF